MNSFFLLGLISDLISNFFKPLTNLGSPSLSFPKYFLKISSENSNALNSFPLIIFSISNANSQTKATSDNEAKKRQILRNIANEARKPSPDVQKRLMLRSIAQEARKPQYIKFLNISQKLKGILKYKKRIKKRTKLNLNMV